MTRVLLALLLGLSVLVVWQRGSVAQAHRAADIALAARDKARNERDAAAAALADANGVLAAGADALRQPMTWLPDMRKRTMHRKPLIVSSLIFALATSACTSVGKRPSPPQSCPGRRCRQPA